MCSTAFPWCPGVILNALLIRKRSKGLSAKGKILLQTALALLAGALLFQQPDFNTQVTLPFLKNISPDLGLGYILFATLVRFNSISDTADASSHHQNRLFGCDNVRLLYPSKNACVRINN